METSCSGCAMSWPIISKIGDFGNIAYKQRDCIGLEVAIASSVRNLKTIEKTRACHQAKSEISVRREKHLTEAWPWFTIILTAGATRCNAPMRYFQSSPTAGKPAPIPMKMRTQIFADASQNSTDY